MKKAFFLITGLLCVSSVLYAANGDLIVNGNLGVGTTAPSEKLTVNGNIALSASINKAGLSANAAGLSRLGINSSALLGEDDHAKQGAFISFDSRAGQRAAAIWVKLPNSSLDTEVVSVTNTGNVGIGTTNPLRTLDLGTNGQMTFGNNGLYSTGSPGTFWYSDNLSYGIYKTAGSWSAPNYQQLALRWDTGITIDGGSAYGKSGLILQPNGGNVGIGPASPLAGLHINRAGTWGSLTIQNQYAGSNTHFDYPDGKNYIRGTTIFGDTGNNVGIATYNPLSRLSVGGDGNSQTAIYGTNPGTGIQGYGGIGVYGSSPSGGVGALGYYNWGVMGQGPSGGYDFYAAGAGVNYGPFTGAHEVKLSNDVPANIKAGMLVSVTGEMQMRKDDTGKINISSTLPTVRLSNIVNDKAVFGVFVMETNLREEHWLKKKVTEGERYAAVNAVGEGRVWVTNMSGDIEPGDYITTSPVPGYGQKQNDDLLHSYTAGKATEKVDWNKVTETVEFGGKTYKVYLIGVVYTSG